MFKVEVTDDLEVKVNGFYLFQLNRPFRKYISKKASATSIDKLLSRKPSDTFRGKYILRYSVPLNKEYVARFCVKRSNKLGCQSLYRTFGDANLFKSKALDHIVSNLDEYDTIKSFLAKSVMLVVDYLHSSFGEVSVFTNLSFGSSVNIFGPEVVSTYNWNLIDVPDNVDKNFANVIHALLNSYEKIPLEYFDSRLFESGKGLDVSFTDVSVDRLLEKQSPCYLFCTLYNAYFAGYIGNLLFDSGVEILPLTLFSV